MVGFERTVRVTVMKPTVGRATWARCGVLREELGAQSLSLDGRRLHHPKRIDDIRTLLLHDLDGPAERLLETRRAARQASGSPSPR
jgi:hypothetical protein